MKNDIGSFIRQRRKTMGWSQEKLAEEIHVNERTIRRIEKNEGAGEDIMTAIYSALNISFQKLDERKSKTPEMAHSFSSINSSRDLAYVLINADHLEINDQTYNNLSDELEGEWLVDTFVEKCELIVEIWDKDNPDKCRALLNILQNELDSLHKRNIFVSGSCTESLEKNLKITSLFIYKS